MCAQSELDLRGKSLKVLQGGDKEAEGIPTKTEVLRHIAESYLKVRQTYTKEEFDAFLDYMRGMRLVITGLQEGSVIIIVECTSQEILEGLWADYETGYLNEVAQKIFRTAEVIREFGEVKFTISILEEEYKACRACFQPLSGKLKFCCNVVSSKIIVNNEKVNVQKTRLGCFLNDGFFTFTGSEFKILGTLMLEVNCRDPRV